MHLRRQQPATATLHYGRRALLDARRFHTAVSLHAHTWYSREGLDFIGSCAARTPLVNGLVRRDIERYRRKSGRTIDVSRAFFRPPLHPKLVFDSEVDQIVRAGLSPLVSITDHDSIKAGQSLRADRVDPQAPISLEWTVPFGTAVFHAGVHNLPPAAANGIMKALRDHTLGTGAVPLAGVLDWLSTFPHVLVVLNHPLWDLTDSGPAQHRASLIEFLGRCGAGIHALELNGFRTQDENVEVLRLARERGLPIVAGGDRHGRAANAVLNLSTARSFDEFAAGVRDGASTDLLLTSRYFEPLPLRKLETAAEILRRAPDQVDGRACWTDRIFYCDGGPFRPLREHWPGGPPPWLTALVFAVAHLPLRSAARAAAVVSRRPCIPAADDGVAGVLPALLPPGHDLRA